MARIDRHPTHHSHPPGLVTSPGHDQIERVPRMTRMVGGPGKDPSLFLGQGHQRPPPARAAVQHPTPSAARGTPEHMPTSLKHTTTVNHAFAGANPCSAARKWFPTTAATCGTGNPAGPGSTSSAGHHCAPGAKSGLARSSHGQTDNARHKAGRRKRRLSPLRTAPAHHRGDWPSARHATKSEAAPGVRGQLWGQLP
jgi:hypothetical protein